MRFGFSNDDEYEPESQPSHVGEIGQLTTNDDDDDDDASISFTHHVYLQISVGPFSLVIGRPD